MSVWERRYLRAAVGDVVSGLAMVGACALVPAWAFLGFLAG